MIMDHDHSSKEALILEILASTGPQTMEQAIAKLPDLGWNELFYAVDNLSRRGEIILRRQGFEYELTSASSPGVCVSERGKKDVDEGGEALLEG